MSSILSLGGFAAVLTRMAATRVIEHVALEKAAVIIETEAKRVIGTYDYGWPQLSEYTLARKAANTPLLETGEMRESIEHQVHGRSASIGSNEDKAVWQELGTVKIPARSFLVGAMVHKGKEAAEAVGGEFFAHLISG